MTNLEVDQILFMPVNTAEEAVTNAIAAYNLAAEQIRLYEAAKVRAKNRLSEIMVETGRLRFETPAGSASISSPSIRTSWDTDALNALIADDPTLAGRILPYRRQTEVAGTLVVRAPGAQRERADG